VPRVLAKPAKLASGNTMRTWVPNLGSGADGNSLEKYGKAGVLKGLFVDF